jgi:hypothetical protein
MLGFAKMANDLNMVGTVEIDVLLSLFLPPFCIKSVSFSNFLQLIEEAMASRKGNVLLTFQLPL